MLGVGLSLDDDGVGPSSLSYLRILPAEPLADADCDVVQGFLLGRPVAAHDLVWPPAGALDVEVPTLVR